MEKINKVLIVLFAMILISGFGLLYARSYSNRPIEETDQLLVTDAEGNEHLNKYSQLETFVQTKLSGVDGDFAVTGNVSIDSSLTVTGNAVFSGEISDSIYFADDVTVEGDLKVNGVVYGYDAYDFAAITTKGDTMIVDSADVYRTITCPFTNKYAYSFTATDSGIVYTGEETRLMEIVAVATYYTNKSTNVITHGIEINDTLRVGSLSPFKTQNAGYYGLVNILGSHEIKTGDRIELVVASDTADTSIMYPRYSTSIKVVR